MPDFGSLLRRYRRNSHDPDRGGNLTQPKLVELLDTYAGLPGYYAPQVSEWEHNKRAIAHTDRDLLIGLIQVFHHCGGIRTVAEANALLRAGKYSDMDADEIRLVDEGWLEGLMPATEEEQQGTLTNQTNQFPIERLSPFVAGPPITIPRQFFGRTREVRRLFNLWQSFPLEHAVIQGPKRSGKTSLLHYIQTITTTDPAQLRSGQRHDWLPSPAHFRWIMVNFQDSRMCKLARLLPYLLTQLDLDVPVPCTLDAFMDVISDNIERPTVVLMDEIGAALTAPELDRAFWDDLRSLASIYANGQLSFVLTAHDSPLQLAQDEGITSPFFNLLRTVQLGPLREVEARELIDSSPIAFPAQDVEWILAESGLWPSLVQILCQTRLAALTDAIQEVPRDERVNVQDDLTWQEEGLQEIERFRYLLE